MVRANRKMTTALVLLASCGVVSAGALEDNRYYTWQIPDPNMPRGSVITSVQITLHDLTTAVEVEGPGLVRVELVDAPPPGWVGSDGRVTVGTLLATPVANDANSVIDLADVVLADSWTHSIFKQPFQISCPQEDGFSLVTMNAAILEFNDYVGNGTPFGLLLRAVGGRATLSRITVTMTIRAYTGEYNKFVSTATIDVPKDLTVIEAWAATERLKLMADFMKRLATLESRIAEAMK